SANGFDVNMGKRRSVGELLTSADIKLNNCRLHIALKVKAGRKSSRMKYSPNKRNHNHADTSDANGRSGDPQKRNGRFGGIGAPPAHNAAHPPIDAKTECGEYRQDNCDRNSKKYSPE